MEALNPLRSVQGNGDNRLRTTVFGILEATDRPHFATDLAKVAPGSRQSISKILKEAQEVDAIVRTDDGYMFTERGAAKYRSITYDIQGAIEEYLKNEICLEALLVSMSHPDITIDAAVSMMQDMDTAAEREAIVSKMMRISGMKASGKTIQASIDATPEVAAKLVESMWMSDPDELGPWSLRSNWLKILYGEFDRHPMLRIQPAEEFTRHEKRDIDMPEPVTETALALGDIEMEEEFEGGTNYRLVTGRRGGEVPEITDDMTLSL